MPETAATTRRRDSVVRASLNLLHLAGVSRLVIRIEPHLERERLVAGRANLHAVRSRLGVKTLKDSIEVVHHAGVDAVDEHLRVARLDLQTKRRLFTPVVAARVPALRIAAAVRLHAAVA